MWRNPSNPEDVRVTHYSVPDHLGLPRVNIGDRTRCRCVVNNTPLDHCHQVATGEDFLCDYCRHICWVENPTIFVIDMEGVFTPESCLEPGRTCPEPYEAHR